MRKESSSIILFLLTLAVSTLAISYVNYLGYWITTLVGTALVLTVAGVSYNLAFILPIFIGVILCALGLWTKSSYVDYILLGVGASFLAMGLLEFFPVLLSLIP